VGGHLGGALDLAEDGAELSSVAAVIGLFGALFIGGRG
jgi:hypothetical protein